MAMDQEIAGTLLTAAAAAFIRHVVGLRGPDGLRVDPLRGLGNEWRVLIQTAAERGRLSSGLAWPANRPTVDVVDVEDFRAPVNDALLYGVAQVAAGDRCGR